MGSDHCAGLVTRSLERLDGVNVVGTNIATHGVDVEFDPENVTVPDLQAAVERAGYDVADAREVHASRSNTVELTVPGMGSDHCAGLVRRSIERLAGIAGIRTNIANHVVSVDFQADKADEDEIKAAIERAGYEVARVQTPQVHSQHC
jgi:Cu+-exporting ATPase